MTHNVIATPYEVRGEGGAEPVFGALVIQRPAASKPATLPDAIPVPSGEPEAYYFGFAAQNVPAGGLLKLNAYDPAGETSEAVALPGGRWLIAYGVNASAIDAPCPVHDPACTVTTGLAPVINGEHFARGSSFATHRAEGSAALGSSFIVELSGEENTLGFYNPGRQDGNYQLLNVTALRV